MQVWLTLVPCTQSEPNLFLKQAKVSHAPATSCLPLTQKNSFIGKSQGFYN